MAPIVRASERTINVKKTANIEAATGATLWQALHALSLDLEPGQTLVDSAYFTNALMRAPKALWEPLDARTRQQSTARGSGWVRCAA